MARRKRKHIPAVQRLASALAMLLPEPERRALRERRAPATEVVRLFTFDHGHLHALGGSDKWWNIWPEQRGPALKAKDARDTSVAAKVKRVSEDWRAFTRKMAKPGKSKRRSATRRRAIANAKPLPRGISDWKCNCGRDVYGDRCRGCGSVMRTKG